MTDLSLPQRSDHPNDAPPEIHYCCGFLVDDQLNVLLVHKNRPRWQAGRWNGVGGKLKVGETFVAAMVREFVEETALQTAPSDWRLFAILAGGNDRERFRVEFFISRGSHAGYRSATDEPIAPWPVHSLPKKTVGDIDRLIHLALADTPSIVHLDTE